MKMNLIAIATASLLLAACTQSAAPSPSPSASSVVATSTVAPSGSGVASGRVELRVVTPENGANVGDARGSGWIIDILTRGGSLTTGGGTSAPSSASPSASATATPAATIGTSTGLLCPNPTAQQTEAPGPNAAFPGLVVLVSTNPDPRQNLAGLFRIGIEDTGTARECQAVHQVLQARFGVGVDSEVTAFVVDGTAPATIPADRSGLRIISNEVTVRFHINGQQASGAPATATPTGSARPTVSPTPTATPSKTP